MTNGLILLARILVSLSITKPCQFRSVQLRRSVVCTRFYNRIVIMNYRVPRPGNVVLLCGIFWLIGALIVGSLFGRTC